MVFNAVSSSLVIFLSTLSLRRATIRHRIPRQPPSHFYPRSPCGERPWQRGSRITYVEFLSTLSLRRATRVSTNSAGFNIISIHALLAESDPAAMLFTFLSIQFLSTLSLRRATCGRLLPKRRHRNFYPRSPCGERPPKIFRHCTTYLFLSTLSLRRATRGQRPNWGGCLISIHALLAESDYNTSSIMKCQVKFLSTLSLRRAT